MRWLVPAALLQLLYQCAAFTAQLHCYPAGRWSIACGHGGRTSARGGASRRRCHSVVLMGTMPSIEFREGEVLANSIVSDRPGSKLLRIKARDKEHAAEYSPGHVLALRIPGVEEEHVEGKHGDGCTAPYTITSCNRAKGTMSVLYRVIEGGRMSQRLDKISRGGAVLFGGRFKDAIGDAVAEEASHVICISTGVGLGELFHG